MPSTVRHRRNEQLAERQHADRVEHIHLCAGWRCGVRDRARSQLLGTEHVLFVLPSILEIEDVVSPTKRYPRAR